MNQYRPGHFATLKALLKAGGEILIALLNCSKMNIALLEFNISFVSFLLNLQRAHLQCLPKVLEH